LRDKSKKISKFSYTTLEIAETLDQLGHAGPPERYGGKVNGGER
jgi:hypothetical protein